MSTDEGVALDLGNVRCLAELVARKALSPNVRKIAYDALALVAEVERLTQQRDDARNIAVHLEQQNARCLELADEWDDTALDIDSGNLSYNEGCSDAKFSCAADIQRILGAFPDDETAESADRCSTCGEGCGYDCASLQPTSDETAEQ